MKQGYIIALDTHCAFTEVDVYTATGRLSRRERCPATIPALREVVEKVPRPRDALLEEGPLADWVARGLAGYADDHGDWPGTPSTCRSAIRGGII